MKQFLSTLAMVALISSPAFAQKKKTTRAAAPAAASTPAPSAPVYSYSGGAASTYSSGPAFSAAATLGSIGGTFVAGPTLTVEWPVNMSGNDFSFGARTGILFGSDFWTIPIMATGKFHFGNSGQMKFYAGLGMGIAISHVTVPAIVIGPFSTPSVSASSTDFALLVTPGMSFGDAGQWFAELPLGTIASGFAILPTFGYHF